MAKVLLGSHNIEKYINRETMSIQVDGNVILPPGIKDYLQTEGISLKYVKPKETPQSSQQRKLEVVSKGEEKQNCISEEAVGMLTARIVSILKNEHQMTDQGMIKRICLQVINQINQ